MTFPRHGNFSAGFSTAWKKFSTPWKTFRLFFHGMEKVFHSMETFPPVFPRHGKSFPRHGKLPAARRGAALIVALWTILILSLLISGLAYEMHIQSGITSYSRKRLKAQVAARGGAEYAKFLLAKSFETSAFEEADLDKETFRVLSKNLERGIGVSGIKVEMGEAFATVDVVPEAGRRNVNLLQDEDWEELLDQAGVPEEIWPDLIDCFMDFTDANDDHRLHGAEADDAFYKERGYAPKNAPLDTIDELLLVKGFTPEIVYGGPPPPPPRQPPPRQSHRPTPLSGRPSTRQHLTLTAGGKMMDEWVGDDLLRLRLGDDGIPNTKDDGFASVQEAIQKTGMDPALADKISVADRRFVRVVSIGESAGVRMGVWAVFEVGRNLVTPIYWREEQMQ